MQSHMIVPLDGTTKAEAILPHALFFALQTQSVLTLLRVIMPPGEPAYGVPYIPDDWYAGEAMWTRNYLGGLAARLQPQGVRVQTKYVEGVSAGGAITFYAVEHAGTRLIALASNGRGPGGRLLFGNVARDVFATAPTSLLLLHPPKDEQFPPGPIKPASYQTIVVPLDDTELSKRALERATTLAQDCHASLLLVADLPIHFLVLPLDMVENSISLLQTAFGPIFCDEVVQRGLLFPERGSLRVFLRTPYSSPGDMRQHPIWLRCLSIGHLWQGAREQLASRPPSGGSLGCHRWRSLSVALRQKIAPSFSWLHERYPQRGMGAHKMVVGSPPF